MGLKVIGFLDDGVGGEDPMPGVERLGCLQDLNKVGEIKPDRIVVASNSGFMGFDLGTLMTLGQGGGFPPHMFLGGAVNHDALSNPSPTQNPTQ